ncbi:MAG TPA: hypothetical protein VF532_22445 [Candidatus Angelobacter sp.]
MANHVVATLGDGRVTTQKLEALGWGLFFVWIGIALLVNLGWGVGILGVGIIILGVQMARRYMAMQLDTFWVVVGTLFVLAGIWELLSVRVSLVPIVCIVAGAVLLVSALAGKPKG